MHQIDQLGGDRFHELLVELASEYAQAVRQSQTAHQPGMPQPTDEPCRKISVSDADSAAIVEEIDPENGVDALKATTSRQAWAVPSSESGGPPAPPHPVGNFPPTPRRRNCALCFDRDLFDDIRYPEAKVLTARNIFQACLTSAAQPCKLTYFAVEDVLQELRCIKAGMSGISAVRQHEPKMIAWTVFEQLMTMPDLVTWASDDIADDVISLQHLMTLGGTERASERSSWSVAMKHTDTIQSRMYGTQKSACTAIGAMLSITNSLVTASILLSLLCLGLSLDNDPEWIGWQIFEVFFACVFILEVVVKLVAYTPRAYFRGPGASWNIMDFVLTCIAVADVVIGLAGEGSNGGLIMVLRGLRLARIARLLKLVRMPLLAQLANMVTGLLVSTPWLFWVMVMLSGSLYLCGILLRSTVSQASLDALKTCGSADRYDIDSSAPGCELTHLYAAEYCGSVFRCMHTIFRCWIGDCSSMGGRPLNAFFSEGYGWRFDLFYIIAMVCVMFGLFNVITALFVEATLSGLRSDEEKQRYAKQHETNFMSRRIDAFCVRVMLLVKEFRESGMRKVSESDSNNHNSVEILCDEVEFNYILADEDIRVILRDIDVECHPRDGIIEASSTSGESFSRPMSWVFRLLCRLSFVRSVLPCNVQRRLWRPARVGESCASKVHSLIAEP
eukprot:TRINITY_DN5443_c0_g1_i1.p1 TRINITY_DN5443_c0_g1~~TRINITY_DN5443_c0_g1_i1.p1  ORF type:complete len:717 (-),score=89.80 TRINITY_DN5443_c0_g1_i1:87-2105(-)